MFEISNWSNLKFAVTVTLTAASGKWVQTLTLMYKWKSIRVLAKRPIVWETLASLIGTQYVLINLTNDALQVRQREPASAFKMRVNSISFLCDVHGLIAPPFIQASSCLTSRALFKGTAVGTHQLFPHNYTTYRLLSVMVFKLCGAVTNSDSIVSWNVKAQCWNWSGVGNNFGCRTMWPAS